MVFFSWSVFIWRAFMLVGNMLAASLWAKHSDKVAALHSFEKIPTGDIRELHSSCPPLSKAHSPISSCRAAQMAVLQPWGICTTTPLWLQLHHQATSANCVHAWYSKCLENNSSCILPASLCSVLSSLHLHGGKKKVAHVSHRCKCSTSMQPDCSVSCENWNSPQRVEMLSGNPQLCAARVPTQAAEFGKEGAAGEWFYTKTADFRDSTGHTPLCRHSREFHECKPVHMNLSIGKEG